MHIQTRTPGPPAPGGFPTISGTADERPVHWIGDEERAQELERQFRTASPLLRLMLLNAYTIEGLTPDEVASALLLIDRSPETDSPCGACGNSTSRAIADTGICRVHNRYALRTRK